MAPRRGSADYVRQYYQVPAKRGMLITVAGKPCRITGFRGQYLLVRYPDEPILGLRVAHPVWSVVYSTKEQS